MESPMDIEMTKAPTKRMEPKIGLATVISLCCAIAAGSWALATTIANGSGAQVHEALKTADSRIMTLFAADTEQAKVQERILTELAGIKATLSEIKADMRGSR